MNEVLQRLINDGLRALMMPSFSCLNAQVVFVSDELSHALKIIRWIMLSTLHANIQDVFNEFGVQIMSLHYFQDPTKKV